MKKRRSVRNTARKTLSIGIRPAIVGRASRPGFNLRGICVENRLIFGGYSLLAKRLGRRVVVENLRQRDKPVEGTRVAL